MLPRLGTQRCVYCLVVATASLLSIGCATTNVRCVDIPSTDNDPSPSVVVRVTPFQPSSDPGAPTGIELSSPTSPAGADTTTLVSNVDVGTHLQITFNAMNGAPNGTTGGVKRLTFTIERGDSVLLRGVSDLARPEHGQVPNALAFVHGNIRPKRPILIMVVDSVPIVVTATATNFNGHSNTLKVTYVPIDHASARKALAPRRGS